MVNIVFARAGTNNGDNGKDRFSYHSLVLSLLFFLCCLPVKRHNCDTKPENECFDVFVIFLHLALKQNNSFFMTLLKIGGR